MEGWQGMYGSDEDAETVAYDEFRDLARDEGLLALDVQVVQAPGDANGRTAVVLASARTAQGVFSAVGEASPLSAPAAWHPFLTTLAELRAKARALRDLTGQEQPVREELSVPYSPSLDENAAPRMASPARATAPRPSPNTPSTSTPALDVPRPTAPASASPPEQVAPSVAQAAEFVRAAARRGVSDVGGEDDGDDGDDSPDEEVASPSPLTPTAAVRPAPRDAAPAAPMARVARPATNVDDDDEIPPDGITPDTVAKLMRYATDIAAHEGTDLSDAEARQKLDDFFVRAFRHPMSRATRIEGQRVLQKLSSDLARKRTAPDANDADDADDE